MKNSIYFLIAIFFLVTCKNEPKAYWISTDNATETNTWLCFRKKFTLNDTIVKTIADISVDSKYWLWLNDSLIVTEGQLKRGPTPKSSYYDKIDLSGSLKRGGNTIAVLVWYFGKHGFSHNSSGLAGLYFNCPEINLFSDKSWKVIHHPAFYNTKGVQPNYRLAESNIGFDARDDFGGWQSLKYNDSGWKQAIEAGCPPAKPWGELVTRPIPLFKNYGLASYTRTEKEGNKVTGYLPYDAQVTPYIKVKAQAGKIIDMRTDDYIQGNNTACASVRSEYITRKGIQEFETFGWMSGHKVIYTIPEGVDVIDVKYRETGYDTKFTGLFYCDDDFYNVLWEKARRTVYVNMHDNFSDCPERERGQWWGDLTNEIAQIHYGFDTRSLDLARKAIRNLVDWQRDDSTIYAPVPSGNYCDELPQQMLASCGYYGFWDFFMYSGDTAIIKYVYPSVKKYMGLWKLNDQNLVVHRGGEWDWADWGENTDDRLMDNAWYILLLKGASGMAKICGYGQDAINYENIIRKIRKAVNQCSRIDNIYRSPGYKGLTDDRANALAVLSGIADSTMYESITSFLDKEMRASPYMERYVLEALCEMKNYDIALKRIKKRYAEMVSSPLSTLWESWNYNPVNNGNCTYNHGWSGGPMVILSKYIAGIAPESPGYGVYHIYPEESGWKELRSNISTVRGDIMFYMNNNEIWKKEYRISSPPGTQALFRIRRSTVKSKVMVNGRTIIANDHSRLRKAEGCEIYKQDQDYYYLLLSPGSWTILVMQF